MNVLDDRLTGLREALDIQVRSAAPTWVEPRRRTGLRVAAVVVFGMAMMGSLALGVRHRASSAVSVLTDGWFRQAGAQMEPTITGGEWVKVTTEIGPLRRADLVVIGLNPQRLVRVVGLPGETVSITNGLLLVNGVALRMPGIRQPEVASADQSALSIPPGVSYAPISLASDEYLVSQDNSVGAFAVVRLADIVARAEYSCSVFMKSDAAQDQIENVATQISRSPLVASYRFIDKAASIEEMRRLFANDVDLIAALERDGTVPTSFRLLLIDRSADGRFQASMSGLPGTQIVRCGEPVTQNRRVDLSPEPTTDGAGASAVPAAVGPDPSETTVG